MTKIDSVESRVESYLDRVRTALHGLPERQIDDIMRELRAHAIELAEGRGVEAALASLGDPVDLAKAYRAESQMVRAECSSSSLRILLGLRHAGRTRAGRFAATVLYVFGYVYVVTLWMVAADKLLFPSRTGLWYVPGDWKSIALRTKRQPPARRTRAVGMVADTGRHSCRLDFAVLDRQRSPVVASPLPPV
jgi:Predicted membrane protein